MNRPIQDPLEVAGLEAGNLAVEPRPAAVEPMSRDACDLQAHVAGGGGVTLVAHLHPLHRAPILLPSRAIPQAAPHPGSGTG